MSMYQMVIKTNQKQPTYSLTIARIEFFFSENLHIYSQALYFEQCL